MPLRTIAALAIVLFLLTDGAALWAQNLPQTRQELEQQLKLAQEAKAKLEKGGVNIDKDCPEIAKNLSEKKGDDRLIVVKRKNGSSQVMTIKQYRELLSQNKHSPEEINKYIQKANQQADDYAQNCSAALQIKIMEAQINATGQATNVGFVWQESYDGFAVGAQGMLNGGYPSWTFQSNTPVPPFNPDPRSFEVHCSGKLDGGAAIPDLEGSGEMMCQANWRAGGHPKHWECSGGGGHPPNAKSPPEPRHGGARSFGLGGTSNFFFLVWGCNGKSDSEPKKTWFVMGIRENRLGGPSDPKDWK